ncbi:MAG: DUF4143 domain-containing protein [Haliscomenobacter sp.]|nr:DUF4143 domain-containing protein [Haliscomenobacter sp.]
MDQCAPNQLYHTSAAAVSSKLQQADRQDAKVVLYDTGLACALLNLRSTEDVNRHFAKGALFENFVINEVLKNHLNRNLYQDTISGMPLEAMKSICCSIKAGGYYL